MATPLSCDFQIHVEPSQVYIIIFNKVQSEPLKISRNRNGNVMMNGALTIVNGAAVKQNSFGLLAKHTAW